MGPVSDLWQPQAWQEIGDTAQHPGMLQLNPPKWGWNLPDIYLKKYLFKRYEPIMLNWVQLSLISVFVQKKLLAKQFHKYYICVHATTTKIAKPKNKTCRAKSTKEIVHDIKVFENNKLSGCKHQNILTCIAQWSQTGV